MRAPRALPVPDGCLDRVPCGFGRRNFMVPIPKVASFDELNTFLLNECLKDDARQVTGQPLTIGAAWES